MIIKCDLYLERLIRREKNSLIKVIIGLRRCGKSYLLFKKALLREGLFAWLGFTSLINGIAAQMQNRAAA